MHMSHLELLMDSAKLMEETVKLLKFVLVTNKNGILMINLDKSYHEMVGSRIPFRYLGFLSLESFIKLLKDAFILQNDRSHRMKVELKPHSDQNIDHFQDLVQNQKSQVPSRAKS